MTVPPDIDVARMRRHLAARRRGVIRYILGLLLLFLGALLVGVLLGLLIPGDDPNWSAPHATYTRIGEAP